MVRDLKPEAREALDASLLRRPGEADPETGLRRPAWWKGDEEAAALAARFGRRR